MRSVLVSLALLGSLSGISIARAELPKPGPEQKKLEIMVGEFTYEGEQSDSPFGPKGKLSGTTSIKFILGGFFVQETWNESNPIGPLSGIDIYSYDAKKKSYVHSGFANDGGTMVSTFTLDGNTKTTTSTMTTDKGEQVMGKGVTHYTPSGFSSSWKYSRDNGKTWLPLVDFKGKKNG